MITDLAPYPAYKDSGVAWLGEVPGHWYVKRLKRVATLNPSKSEAKGALSENATATFLPMSRVGTDGRIDASETQVASTLWNGFTYFRRGDVLVAKITPCFENGKGACLDALPTKIGFGSTEFIVARATNALLPRFLYRVTTLSEFRRLGADAMVGAAGQQRIPPSFVAEFPIALPSLAEQAAIVRFLDHADRRIRRYIRAKQKLIKLLEEQKQAIIHRAVTRGLDPNVRLKPSGVEWLGDVPEHWVVSSLRFRYEQCLGKMVDEKKVTNTRLLPYLRNADVQWDCINTKDLPRIDIGEHEHERFTVRDGDLLVCEGRHLGRAAIWRGEMPVCAFQKALHRLRARDSQTDLPRYLYYCLYVVHFQDAFGASSSDTSIPHLTGEMLRAFRFSFPPLSEQSAIAAHLDDCSGTVGHAQRALEEEVRRMREYRTRLIADVVTGKLDVREAASRLPDERDESEPLDTTDGEVDADERADGLDAEAEETEA